MRKLSLILIIASCGGTDTNTTDDTASGYAAALSVDAAVQESGLFAAIAEKLTAAATTGDAAATEAQSITALFMPQGCATYSTEKNVTTYTFHKCTGPYGLLKLDGIVTATFTPMVGKMKVDLVSTGFKISTVTVNVAASAILETGLTQASASVTSSSSATNARGESMSHSGSYTAGWDATCLTLNGTFTTTIGAASWSTTIANFRQCSGMCPDFGGTVTLKPTQGGTITVHYSNGSTAEVTTTTAGGTRGMIVLACGAA